MHWVGVLDIVQEISRFTISDCYRKFPPHFTKSPFTVLSYNRVNGRAMPSSSALPLSPSQQTARGVTWKHIRLVCYKLSESLAHV